MGRSNINALKYFEKKARGIHGGEIALEIEN
jgi:hypothetical protein